MCLDATNSDNFAFVHLETYLEILKKIGRISLLSFFRVCVCVFYFNLCYNDIALNSVIRTNKMHSYVYWTLHHSDS